MRDSGLGIIGEVPWGTHFCQFYQGRQDLIDTLVPYFAAGLARNEFCMWVTSAPLQVEDAKAAMRAAVPRLDAFVASGQIRFLDYAEWYTCGGRFDAGRVLRGWVEELEAATARGFEGLRLTGNTFWLEDGSWRDFTDYEAAVDRVIGQYPMLAMCTYSLDRCGAVEIMDVMSNHAFAIIKRGGEWQVIESAERRKIEASLRDSEARYRSLFNGMTEGFALHEILCDDEGEPSDYRFVDVNPAFERLTGLARDRVVGRLLSEVLPDEDPEWVRRFGRVALTGEPVHFDNFAPTLGRHYDVFAYRPAPRQFAVLFLDVTAQKRAERELAEANRLKDEFLATLSHELRTPLHAILGWAELLAGGRLDAVSAARAAGIIVRNAKAQAQLVSDVLDVSRIVAGKLRLDPREVDLAGVLGDAIEGVRPAAEAKGIALTVSTSAGSLRVNGDADRLQQVVWNLLSNAVKFTPPGGRVNVDLREEADGLTIVVRDTGIGIDAAFLPRVFGRFMQADSSASREHGGLGLGLAIVRHLVELHGGTVHAASDGVGRGSTFTVRLPVRAPREALPPEGGARVRSANPPAVARALPAFHDLRVLVVDDEADARELVKAVLEGRGMRVTVAASGPEARELAAADPPELVLADIGMPGEDGYEFLRRFREEGGPRLAAVPVLALTAYGQRDDRARALATGFQGHLMKPVVAEDLVAAVLSATKAAAAWS